MDLIAYIKNCTYRTAGLITLLCLFGLTAQSTKAQPWRDRMAVADSLSSEGQFGAAADSLQLVIAQAEAIPETPDTALGRIFYKIGYNSLQNGDYQRALVGFKRSLSIYRDNLGPTEKLVILPQHDYQKRKGWNTPSKPLN